MAWCERITRIITYVIVIILFCTFCWQCSMWKLARLIYHSKHHICFFCFYFSLEDKFNAKIILYQNTVIMSFLFESISFVTIVIYIFFSKFISSKQMANEREYKIYGVRRFFFFMFVVEVKFLIFFFAPIFVSSISAEHSCLCIKYLLKKQTRVLNLQSKIQTMETLLRLKDLIFDSNVHHILWNRQ